MPLQLISPDAKQMAEPRFGAPFASGAGGTAEAARPDGKRGFTGREGGRQTAPRFRLASNFTPDGSP